MINDDNDYTKSKKCIKYGILYKYFKVTILVIRV